MHIRVELEAHFATPFSIGTGALGGTTADKPLLKDAEGVPYLPGSALKGIVRHEAEKIMRSLWKEEAVCRSPNPATMCPQNRPQEKRFCPICRIFGSPWLPSSLIFSDLKPGDRQDRQIMKDTKLRFGVGISRNRKVAAEELLYTLEVAPVAEAVPLRGTIEGNISDKEWKRLLALVIVAVRAVEAIGGAKSRGLGWVVLKAVEIEPVLSDTDIKEVLKEWLTSPSASPLP